MFKDSSLHIAARDSIAWWKAWLIRLIAVLLSLIVCAIVIFGLTKMNPVEVYKGIFSGAVGTSRRAWVTIRDTMVLLLIAIGLTPAFKMKFWRTLTVKNTEMAEAVCKNWQEQSPEVYACLMDMLVK